MNKFWNWLRDEATDEKILRLDGAIAEYSWFDDDITPKQFRDELNAATGDVTVWINSPGGDCFAASQIYTMLKDYGGHVTVKIDGIAASAASVIAMAGETVKISPTGMMMIHNPETVAIGNADEFKSAIKLLDEVKESIINAYELKTSLPREEISRLMDKASWLNANRAVELGFADEILFADNQPTAAKEFSQTTVTNSILAKLRKKTTSDNRVNAVEFYQRLNSRRI